MSKRRSSWALPAILLAVYIFIKLQAWGYARQAVQLEKDLNQLRPTLSAIVLSEQLESALDRWCYFLRHGAELDVEKLPATLAVPEIRKVMEVLTVFTKEEREREAYEQRVKYERDQWGLLFEFSICAYWVGDHTAAVRACPGA